MSKQQEQVQTPFMIYNTERHICSEDLNNLDKYTMSVESKGSDKVASDDTSVLDNLYNGTTGLGSKGSESVGSDNLEKGKYIKTTLRFRKKS